MHILLIHQAFASNADPGGTRHFEFAEHFGMAGHRTTVIAGGVSYLTGTPLSDEQRDRIRVIRPYTYPALHHSFASRVISFVTFMLSALIASLRVREVDIVVGTSPPILQGLTAWAVARLKGVPFVFEVRDLWPDFAVEMGVLKNNLAISLARGVERFLYRHADQLVVNSPGFIQHVSRVGRREPILVPNGVDTALFADPTDRTGVRARWKAGDRFVVLYAGAHGPANDLGTLLEAACLLRGRTDLLFVLVGDGKDKLHLRRLADARRLVNVLFLDAHAKKDMPSLLAAADAGLAILQDLPLFRLTYPNKVFDYMAAGKPCIVAIDGVIREVVDAAGCGIAVPPGDAHALAVAVERLVDDRPRAAAMGANGRQYVAQHFDRRRQAAAMMNVLSQAISEATV